MGLPVITGTYTAGQNAVGTDVQTDLQDIIDELDQNIDSTNLAANAVTTSAIQNDAVTAAKINDGDVRETHMDYSEATDGAKVVIYGPNMVSSSNGMRIARVSKSVTWGGTGTNSVTFTYASDCTDGDPSFSATPVLLGLPVVSSVEVVGATIATYFVTASNSSAITFTFTDNAGNSSATVQIEFGVMGPI
jgi:hypothetical protein